MDPYYVTGLNIPNLHEQGPSPFYNDVFRQIIKGCVYRTLWISIQIIVLQNLNWLWVVWLSVISWSNFFAAHKSESNSFGSFFNN